MDLYDNNIAHIKNLEELTELTSLDLSFNVIKHIKRVGHLKKLRDVFFVQNKISKIEGLEELTELRNLELGGNRIRVRTLAVFNGEDERADTLHIGYRELGQSDQSRRAILGEEQDHGAKGNASGRHWYNQETY